MKRLATVALIVVGVALPICAQRGGGAHGGFSGHGSSGFHGGFSGHSAPAYRGGFRASAPGRSAGAPRSAAGVAQGSLRAGPGNYGARAPYTGARRYRRPYISTYGTGVPYGYPGLIGGYPYGYGDNGYADTSDGNDAQGAANASPDEGDAQPPLEPYQPPALEPWRPDSVIPHPPSTPGSEDAVTLIFKDGRPPEQIHNYLLTRTTLYVNDSYHRDIPTGLLDLVATAKVNHDAGIDFRLPVDTSR